MTTQSSKRVFLSYAHEDLDMVYKLCGDKLVSSFKDLAEKHPDLIGLFWNVISQRTNWISYTSLIDHEVVSLGKSLFYTLYYWICPIYNESKRANMAGFYSSMNYLLENFHEVAKNIEYGLDWVFSDINNVDS